MQLYFQYVRPIYDKFQKNWKFQQTENYNNVNMKKWTIFLEIIT